MSLEIDDINTKLTNLPYDIFEHHICQNWSYRDIAIFSRVCKYTKDLGSTILKSDINNKIHEFRNDPNHGLFYACEIGDQKLVELFIGILIKCCIINVAYATSGPARRRSLRRPKAGPQGFEP